MRLERELELELLADAGLPSCAGDGVRPVAAVAVVIDSLMFVAVAGRSCAPAVVVDDDDEVSLRSSELYLVSNFDGRFRFDPGESLKIK